MGSICFLLFVLHWNACIKDLRVLLQIISLFEVIFPKFACAFSLWWYFQFKTPTSVMVGMFLQAWINGLYDLGVTLSDNHLPWDNRHQPFHCTQPWQVISPLRTIFNRCYFREDRNLVRAQEKVKASTYTDLVFNRNFSAKTLTIDFQCVYGQIIFRAVSFSEQPWRALSLPEGFNSSTGCCFFGMLLESLGETLPVSGTHGSW